MLAERFIEFEVIEFKIFSRFWNIFLDFEIFLSILKHLSRFWNISLDSETPFSILKYISRFWNTFLDSEIFLSILKFFSRFQNIFQKVQRFYFLTGKIHHTIVSGDYYCYINLFGADISHTEKPGGWFAPAETGNSSSIKKFYIPNELIRMKIFHRK